MIESRLIRERMVRGLGAGGTFGLREACRSSVAITVLDQNHNRVSFIDGSTSNCFITEANFNGITTGLNVASGAQSFALGGHTSYTIAVSKVGTGWGRS